MKHTIVIKDINVNIKSYTNYMIVTNTYEDKIIAYRYIKELYIHRRNGSLNSKLYYKLSKNFPVYLIDDTGEIYG